MGTCKKSGCERETSRKYCSRHRCKAVESCENPRQRQSGVCADHTPCTKASCDEPRWFSNNPRAANTFCEEHFYSCRVAGCSSFPASPPSSDDQPPSYCEAHSCNAAECSAPPQAGSTFCQNHLCGVRKCTGSGASRSQGYHYCNEHTCKAYNCANQKSSSGVACRQHRCAVANCQEPEANTAEGRTCCELHACQLPGCGNPSRHAQNPAKVSPFCTDHDCRAPGCERARDLDGGRSYCEAHDLCGKVGCERIKHPTNRFCEEHWDTCSRLNCFTRRKYHLATHSGWYSPSWWRSDRYYSYTKEADPAEYCPSHTCEGCFAARESGRVYCAAPGCGQPREKKSRYGYCDYYHRSCEAPGCTEPCEPPGRACSDAHRCRRSGCLEAISSGEVHYCLQDICKAERCSNARQSVFDRKVGHEFCIDHESMAHRFRPSRALPSSDVNAFHDALLLLPKKKHRSRKQHASSNSGSTGFVVGEVTDDSVPANGFPGDGTGFVIEEFTGDPVPASGFPGDDYGRLNYSADVGPSSPYASLPDEDGNAQGDYALHAEQDASSGAANDAIQYKPKYADAVDTLAQYFDPDILADSRVDADSFQGYMVPGEGYTVVCGVFRQSLYGEEQFQGLEQGAGHVFGDHSAYQA